MAAALSSSVGARPAPSHAALQPGRVFFTGGRAIAGARRGGAAQPFGRTPLRVVGFKFLKDLGLKKPGFLPDFGLEKRKALLDRFYTSYDAPSLDAVLADGLQVFEGDVRQPLGKQELVALLSQHVKPALPDFSWTHVTTGEKDEAGYSIVKIQAVGKHTGAPFSIPGRDLPPIEPSGNRARLPEQTVKVKVEDGHIQEIRYLPKQAWSAEALYTALGGKL